MGKGDQSIAGWSLLFPRLQTRSGGGLLAAVALAPAVGAAFLLYSAQLAMPPSKEWVCGREVDGGCWLTRNGDGGQHPVNVYNITEFQFQYIYCMFSLPSK